MFEIARSADFDDFVKSSQHRCAGNRVLHNSGGCLNTSLIGKRSGLRRYNPYQPHEMTLARLFYD
jgi:hypothetical protein